MSGHNYKTSAYSDPYAAQGSEYLDDRGNPTSGPVEGDNYGGYGYNQYGGDLGPEKTTPNDVDNGVGGTERLQPGRQNIGQAPMSSFAAMGPPPRSTGILRMWRKDERGKQWTRGGGARSTGRLVVCCLTITLLIVISIVLTILMFVRPPSVTVNETKVNPLTAQFDLNNKQMHLDIDLDISVTNPNWFSANFKQIKASIRYPGLDSSFGGGSVYNTNFKAYTASTFTFPLQLNYSTEADPSNKMLKDIANKCGLNNAAKSQITIDYDLKLWLKILSTTISPTISGSTSFDCPFDASSVSGSLVGLKRDAYSLADAAAADLL